MREMSTSIPLPVADPAQRHEPRRRVVPVRDVQPQDLGQHLPHLLLEFMSEHKRVCECECALSVLV